jgi:hypothetical protein
VQVDGGGHVGQQRYAEAGEEGEQNGSHVVIEATRLPTGQ